MPTGQIEARCAFAVSTSIAANLRPAPMVSNWPSPRLGDRLISPKATRPGRCHRTALVSFNGLRILSYVPKPRLQPSSPLGDSGGLQTLLGPRKRGAGQRPSAAAPSRPPGGHSCPLALLRIRSEGSRRGAINPPRTGTIGRGVPNAEQRPTAPECQAIARPPLPIRSPGNGPTRVHRIAGSPHVRTLIVVAAGG